MINYFKSRIFGKDLKISKADIGDINLIGVSSKLCSKCNEEKPLNEFNKRKTSKDGYSYICKECNKKISKNNYYKRDIDTKKAYWKKYRQEHREIIRVHQEKYYQEHREEIRTKNKKYYQEHREEIQAKIKKYLQEHHEEHVENISDSYIKQIIKIKYNIPKEFITQQLIQSEREFLQIKRIIRRLNNGRDKQEIDRKRNGRNTEITNQK